MNPRDLARPAGVNVLFMPVFVLLPLYGRDVLERGPEWYGFLLAGAGGGALIGSAAVGVLLPKYRHTSQLLAYGVGAVFCCVLVIAATSSPAIALCAFVILGARSSTINVMVITTFQEESPSAVRGRVMSIVIALSTGATPLGMAAGGLIGDASRDSIPLVFAGCGVAMMILIALSRHRLSVDTARPDARSEI